MWYQGDSGQALPFVEHTQDVQWLPEDVGVVIRSTSGLLWSDFSSGVPMRLVNIEPGD